MRVLLIPEQFPTDQNPVAGIFMQEQIKALNEFAHPVVFNSTPWYRGEFLVDPQVENFDFHSFPKKPPLPLRLAAYALWERRSLLLGKKIPGCDVVHLHGAALRGGWALKLARHWGAPLVVTEHTGPWSVIADRPRVWKRSRKVMGSAAAVLPVSRHLSTEIAESGIRPGFEKVTGNPVDTECFFLRKAGLSECNNILFVGRLDPFKGGLRTLKAFEKASSHIPDFRLTLIGEGAEAAEIRAFISAHELQGRVSFIEETLDRRELRDAFHAASFLVFPSVFESFGLVGAEALSTGLPVLITDRTGPKDYAHQGNSIAVDPSRVDDIARGMVDMVKRLPHFDPKEIRRDLVERFGIKAYAERLRSVYERVLSGHASEDGSPRRRK